VNVLYVELGTGVYHEYERLANLPEALIPDFTLYAADGRPVFVEFWGLIARAHR